MKKIKLFITLIFSLFLSSINLQADSSYAASNYAEIACAVLRGPLAGISNYYYAHNEHSGKARAVHLATDCLRLANIILSIKNHPHDLKKYTTMWGLIDSVNLLIDSLQTKSAVIDENNDLDEHFIYDDEEYQKLYSLIKKLRATLAYGILPAIEGVTAIATALSVDGTQLNLNNSLSRLRLQAAQSLSRSINMFLNAKTKNEKISSGLFVLLNIAMVAEDFSSDKRIQVPRARARNVNAELSNEHGFVIIITRTDETVDRIVLGFLIPDTDTVIPGDSTVRVFPCCNNVEVIQHVHPIPTVHRCQTSNASRNYYDFNITPNHSAWFQVHFDQTLRPLRAFQTLELEPTATNDEIRRQYQGLSRRYHPDRNNTPERVTRMQEINRAYDFLLNRNQADTFIPEEDPLQDQNQPAYIPAGPMRLTDE